MIFFASASANQNDLVEREVRQAGATEIQVSSGGVEFNADLRTAYRFCMWTRCATRLLVLVHRTDKLQSTDDLYEHSLTLPWENWVNPDKTFAITETVTDPQGSLSWGKTAYNGQHGWILLDDTIH